MVEKPKIYEFNGVERHSISFNVGGVTGFSGFTYEYLLSPKWNIEFGGGYIGAGLGLSYYAMPVKKGKPRLNITLRSFYYNIPWQQEELVRHCISVGLTHFTENKLTFSGDLGPAYAQDLKSIRYYDPFPTRFPFYFTWTLKVAYRFTCKNIHH